MNGRAQIRNVVFSAATVFALGFGAVQAFAAPGAQQGSAASCTGTQWNQCLNTCRAYGFMSGSCEIYNGNPVCDCYGTIQPGGGW